MGRITPPAALLAEVQAASAFRYDARDSLGNRTDTAKVIQHPAGGYLAVYHSGERCHLATSADLMEWTHRAVVDEPATQPTIAATPDGGQQAGATVDLGFHYHRECRVDRQARGRLTGFRAWAAAADPALDLAIERAAAAAGERIGGNIGDRDHLRYQGRNYDLVEAQGREGDFGSWRVYLHDRSAGTARRLRIVTHGGSTAFANPTTLLRDPSGGEALMVTLFLPFEGAAPGEAGSLLYHVPLDRRR